MGSNILTPTPADFATVALELSQEQTAAHYGISVFQVRRMIGEQSAEWLATFKEKRRARTAAAALVNAAKGRAKILELGGLPRRRVPIPDGLFDDLMTMTVGQVALKHNRSEDLVLAWRTRLPGDQQTLIREAVAKRRAATCAQTGKAFRAARPKAEKPPKPAKTAKTKGKPSGKNWGFNKLPDVPLLAAGIAPQAAQFLQRKGFKPVFRGEVLSKALAGLYVVGKLTLPEAAMVAKARDMGFDPDAWKRVG